MLCGKGLRQKATQTVARRGETLRRAQPALGDQGLVEVLQRGVLLHADRGAEIGDIDNVNQIVDAPVAGFGAAYCENFFS